MESEGGRTDHSDTEMLNQMNLNILDKLLKGVESEEHELNTNRQVTGEEYDVDDTQRDAENIGDAWFKKISEMERGKKLRTSV